MDRKASKWQNKILDVGCGEGSLVKYLNNNKRNIVGIDISKKGIEKVNKYIKKTIILNLF